METYCHHPEGPKDEAVIADKIRDYLLEKAPDIAIVIYANKEGLGGWGWAHFGNSVTWMATGLLYQTLNDIEQMRRAEEIQEEDNDESS